MFVQHLMQLMIWTGEEYTKYKEQRRKAFWTVLWEKYKDILLKKYY